MNKEFEKKQLVYVASPYTNSSRAIQETNLVIGMNACEEIWKSGRFIPYFTLLTHYYNKNHYSHEYEEWMEYCFQILSRCDVLLRLPGESSGADREVEFAKQNNIPIYYTLEDLLGAI
jgi:hypothetical protein